LIELDQDCVQQETFTLVMLNFWTVVTMITCGLCLSGEMETSTEQNNGWEKLTTTCTNSIQDKIQPRIAQGVAEDVATVQISVVKSRQRNHSTDVRLQNVLRCTAGISK
jgi:hypothetical protein